MSLFHIRENQDDYDAKAAAAMDDDDLHAAKAFVVWMGISAAIWGIGILVAVS